MTVQLSDTDAKLLNDQWNSAIFIKIAKDFHSFICSFTSFILTDFSDSIIDYQAGKSIEGKDERWKCCEFRSGMSVSVVKHDVICKNCSRLLMFGKSEWELKTSSAAKTTVKSCLWALLFFQSTKKCAAFFLWSSKNMAKAVSTVAA